MHRAPPVTKPDQADSGPHTGPDSDVDTERELHDVMSSTPMDSPLLRQAIRAHAAALRELGLLPEQMLVRVKSLILPSMASRRLPHRMAADQEWVRLRLTRWAVESYYGFPGRENERSPGSDGEGSTG